MSKTYTLKIPRGQFDRIASAHERDDVLEIDRWDYDNDMIIFTISEEQRKRWASHGKKQVNHLYWIAQMFLPKNITEWEVE